MADDVTPEPAGFGKHLKAAIVGAHDHLAESIDARKKANVANVLEQFEADLAPHLAPLVAEALANPGMPEHLRDLLAEVGAPQHFSSSLLIGVAVGAIIGPILGSAVEPYVQSISNNAWAQNPSRPLPPDLLAASVLKGVQSESTAAATAQESGYSAGAFSVMVDTAGQSIGIAEALLLFRRGQIDAGHLQEIMQYSNLNPRFYGDVVKLQYGPPTAGEVIAGALKSHLSDGDARTKLGQAGIDPVNFDWMRATAGRPFSVHEALDLWNRGEISESRVDQVIAQSDVNPDFGADYKKLRIYYPPVRSIVPMLRSGAITEAQARDLLTKQGVQPDIVTAFVKEATTTKQSAGKDLTQAQVTRLYGARLLTRAEANTKLTALGLDAAEVGLLLDYVDAERTEKITNQVIGKIRTLYVAHKLTKTAANNALSDANVPTATRNDLFDGWDIERTANVHTLSPAAIVGGYRRGYITPAACKTRLLAAGVQLDDIGIVVADGWPPTKASAAQAAAQAVVNA